ncbi:hypothetical protein JMJ77_0001402, partial [Colletotrichum scovillei]
MRKSLSSVLWLRSNSE